jgi:hypothetical protein
MEIQSKNYEDYESDEWDGSDIEEEEYDYNENIQIDVDIDYGSYKSTLKIHDVIDYSRIYKDQYVLFIEGIICIKPNYNYISITIDTPSDNTVIEFSRNDVVYATICDFTNGKEESSIAFGSNNLFKVESLDDMDNPLLARARLLNGVIVLDQIRIIVDDI